MPSSEDYLAEVAGVYGDRVADIIREQTTSHEARRIMSKAALRAEDGEPLGAARKAYDGWRLSPPTPGDLTDAHDKAYADPWRHVD